MCKFPRDENLLQQWLIKIKRRNIQSIMAECVILIASAKIPVGKRCDFTWPYIRLFAKSHHPSTKDNQSTAKEQKLIKCFLPSSHRFFAQSSQYQYRKANKYSILTITGLGLPVPESSTKVSKFYDPLILTQICKSGI